MCNRGWSSLSLTELSSVVQCPAGLGTCCPSGMIIIILHRVEGAFQDRAGLLKQSVKPLPVSSEDAAAPADHPSCPHRVNKGPQELDIVSCTGGSEGCGPIMTGEGEELSHVPPWCCHKINPVLSGCGQRRGQR